MSYWLALIPVGLWLLWFLYHVVKAPYELYQELEAQLREEIEVKDRLIAERDAASANQKCDLQVMSPIKHGEGRTTWYVIPVHNGGLNTADGVEMRLEAVSFVPLGKSLKRVMVLECLGMVGTSHPAGEILPRGEGLWHFLRYNDEISPPVWEFNTVPPYTASVYDPCQNNEYEILVSANAKNAPRNSAALSQAGN